MEIAGTFPPARPALDFILSVSGADKEDNCIDISLILSDSAYG